MTGQIAFRCPSCGSEKFIRKAGAKPTDSLPCAKCGRLFTRNDVRQEGVKVGKKIIQDALAKVPGFKRR